MIKFFFWRPYKNPKFLIIFSIFFSHQPEICIENLKHNLEIKFYYVFELKSILCFFFCDYVKKRIHNK